METSNDPKAMGQDGPPDVPAGPPGSPEGPAARLRKFPYPYGAAVTVASDIDDASYNRFLAVHTLFCRKSVIRPGSIAWATLGLSTESSWYDRSAGGVRGLGLELADSFFLIGDELSMGMYRFDPDCGVFQEDTSDGQNACKAIKSWIRQGEIDAFHGFQDRTRDEVLPLLGRFYRWCESEDVPKPCVWINHSVRKCPSGLCPDSFRPNKAVSLARQLARFFVGPLTGRERRPVSWRQRWYHGARPKSRYYVNDVLHANGLKYVWLEAGQDELPNVIALPEYRHGGRESLLEPVTMDDGLAYYRFRRCYGKVDAPPGVTVALRTSRTAFDASALFTRENLDHLCEVHGTCILYTHWTVPRSLPVQDATIGNFERLRGYRDQGKIWVTRLSTLLEWTRRRAFLEYSERYESGSLIIDIDAVNDPLFGRQPLTAKDCEGLAFDLPAHTGPVVIRVSGHDLPPEAVQRGPSVCWVSGASGGRLAPAADPGTSPAAE
jgi:hypothetical protein